MNKAYATLQKLLELWVNASSFYSISIRQFNSITLQGDFNSTLVVVLRNLFQDLPNFIDFVNDAGYVILKFQFEGTDVEIILT